MRGVKFLVSIFLLIQVSVNAQTGPYVQPLPYRHYSLPFYINIGNGILKKTDTSAYLELGPFNGGSKGFLPPRLSTSERNNIPQPKHGLQIFNRTNLRPEWYDSIATSWKPFGSTYNARTPLIIENDTIKINGLSGYGSSGQMIRSTGSALEYFTPSYVTTRDRFGLSGEDVTASANRSFDLAGYTFFFDNGELRIKGTDAGDYTLQNTGGTYFDVTGKALRLVGIQAGEIDSVFGKLPTGDVGLIAVEDLPSGGGGSGGGIGSFQDSVANVRDYGAVGDGSTEDSTAFKNALATGRDVYVPKGVYKITALNLSPVAGQTIFGDGENTRIITAQTSGAIFKVVNPNVKFMNLAFEGSGKTSSIPGWTTTTYQTGIWVVINSTTITGCTFRKFNGRGVYIFHPSATYILNNTVINNRFFQNTVGIESDYGADYLLIANNSLDSNYACLVEGGNANVYYSGNQATQSTYGYYSRGGATHGSIIGGSFNHCTTGLRIPSGQQGMTVTDTKFWFSDIVLGSSDTVSRVSFVNCVVEGSNVTLTKAKNNTWIGGYIYGSSANVITGTGLHFSNVITAPAGLNKSWSKITFTDSAFNIDEGLYLGRGMYAPNLPTGKKLKQLYWDGGTVYVADSTGTGGGGGGSGWGLTGNSGTAVSTNYVGTSDAISLGFRTNAVERMRIDSSGKLIRLYITNTGDYYTHGLEFNAVGLGGKGWINVDGSSNFYFSKGTGQLADFYAGTWRNTSNGYTWTLDYQGAYTNSGTPMSVGGAPTEASALLQLRSTAKGFLPPVMNATQAEAISSPAEGLMIYSTNGTGSTITSKGWWGWDGSTWVKLN